MQIICHSPRSRATLAMRLTACTLAMDWSAATVLGGERALFGSALCGLGDVDGDGTPDWAVGAPWEFSPHSQGGIVFVVSGKDGTLLHTLHGTEPRDEFGSSLASVGDVDLDGVADLIVGAPSHGGTGYARIHSGATGAMLRELRGRPDDARFGCAAAGIGDSDGDGRPDVAIASCAASISIYDVCRATIYSGADGSDVCRLQGDSPGFGEHLGGFGDLDGDGGADLFMSDGENGVWCGGVVSSTTGVVVRGFPGTRVFDSWGGAAVVGDVDRDGRSDVAIAFCDGSGSPGSVSVYSGRSGALLLSVEGEPSFGHAIAGLGDVDGDGRADFAASHLALFSGGGVACFSGRDGGVLWDLPPEDDQRYTGYALADASDVDADGVHDLLVGTVSPWPPGEPGSVRLVSGRDGTEIHRRVLTDFAGDHGRGARPR